MHVRKVKAGKATFFQIGQKIGGKFVLVKHIGSASSPDEIELLRLKAQVELERIQTGNQRPLFPATETEVRAKLVNWRITGFHQIFGHVYDSIGFPCTLLRDLTIARIAYPKSKLATVRYMERYLGIRLSTDKIYRFLDALNKEELTKIAFDFVSKKNNGVALIFYDVTTLYFESGEEDDLKQKGYSKDHKNELPQILIGLFVDRDGYPFDFDFYEGSTFEGHTFPKAIKMLTEKYQFKDLVVVADAGMLSEKNICFLESENLNYIVGARLKNLSADERKQMLANDYAKEPIYEIEQTNKRLIIDFSEKRAKKDGFNRTKLIKKLEAKLISKKDIIKKSKYLLWKSQGVVAGIDHKKIEYDKQYDGLKGYWTNLATNVKSTEVIDQYHNLWKVEKAFRMSKNDLQERPIFHRLGKRILAHLLICFCSLLVMKETERRLSPKNISLTKTIEVLGKVGQGEATINKLCLPIDSELSADAKTIFHEILGH